VKGLLSFQSMLAVIKTYATQLQICCFVRFYKTFSSSSAVRMFFRFGVGALQCGAGTNFEKYETERWMDGRATTAKEWDKS